MTSKPSPLRDHVKLARNCWIPSAAADDLSARCIAVLECSHRHSVISSVTAAQLHGMWLPELPETIYVASMMPGSAGRAMTRNRRPQFVAHRLQLADEDVVVKDGVLLTSPARTWRDLARTLSLPDLVAAGDSLLRGGTPLDELTSMVAKGVRARGVVQLRRALELLDARSRSRPESHLRVAIRVAGCPPFLVNEPIYRDEGGWLAEPDLALPEAKLALEYQGADHATLERMRSDITRRRDMRMNRWVTLDYGPAEVFRRPWSVGAEVLGYVRQRAPHLLPAR